MANMSTNSNASPVVGANSYSNLSASAQVSATPCNVLGVFCASSTSGTLKLWDQTTAATPVLVNTFNLIGGTWYPIPFRATTALYATIGGTADITIAFS